MAACAVFVAVAVARQPLGPLAAARGTTAELPVEGSRPVRGIIALPSVSADGRLVAFAALSSTFVKHDRNGGADVFVFDRRTRRTVLVSATPAGLPGAGQSGQAQLSADGTLVVFVSEAPDLVAGDSNRTADIFVRDLRTHRTRRLSVDAGHSQANGPSISPVISRDGRHVAFLSGASNLVAGDTNGQPDVFVVDLRTRAVTRADVGTDGAQALEGALNGVAFFATAPFGPGRFVYGVTSLRLPGLAISDDGQTVAFLSRSPNLVAGDANGKADVFVRDLARHTTERVSVSTAGAEGDADSDRPLLSGDGQTVIFATGATNLTDASTPLGAVVVHDRRTNTTALAATDTAARPLRTLGDERSLPLALSPDGRYLALETRAGLISTAPTGKRQVVLADRLTGTVEPVSVNSAGVFGDHVAGIFGAALTPDGSTVLFTSNSSNLAPRGRSGRFALYVRQRG